MAPLNKLVTIKFLDDYIELIQSSSSISFSNSGAFIDKKYVICKICSV